MNTLIKRILKRWESSLERFGKLDRWKIDEELSLLGNYLREREDRKDIRNQVRQIRDVAIRPCYDNELLLNKIKKILFCLDETSVKPVCLMIRKQNGRVKKDGQEVRFKGETKRIFEERLKFKGGMFLRNFDIETENACDARKVRRIVEKRMCQAYRRKHDRNLEYTSNKDRYWMKRATAFQLYNIGQVEHVKYVSRGASTHWKRMFDPNTGEIVFKKKMAYSSKEEAMIAISEWKANHPNDTQEMHAYKCAICKKWHIGHAAISYCEVDRELLVEYDTAS